jgi:5-hydroxyisourate hydrolase-like protein (transthyretin family)
MVRWMLAAAIAITIGACSRATDVTSLPATGYCTAVASPGITVTLMDSVTGQPAAFTDLYALAVDGTFRDSATHATVDSAGRATELRLAYNRAGVYNVTVHADRYQSWTRTGVRVNTAGLCSSVITVPLIARLVPAVAAAMGGG